MTPIVVTLLIFALMLVLMAVRVPIAASMFVAGFVGYAAQAGMEPLLNHLKTESFARFSSYDLSVIPLFLLMGQFASQGGLSRALFRFANGVLGRLHGGMAMAAVVACAAFGAVCGSSVATAATLGSVALPEMKRHGYSGRLATATLAAGGTLGIIVPPSVILVIYGILTEQNIAKLFAAAMIPAALMVLAFVVGIAVYVRMVPGHAPAHDEVETTNLREAVSGVGPIAVIFTIVFGGIYGGIFTPTEGAAVGAAATFIVALARRELGLRGIAASFYSTAMNAGMIFAIFLGADLLNASLALTQVPNQLAEAVGAMALPPMAVIGAIMLLYLVLGCIMDELSVILLTVPIFFPLVMGLPLGVEGAEKAIWFGILVLMTVVIGLITPPVGLNVYIVNGMADDVPIAESYRGIVPFLIAGLACLLLLMLVPELSIWTVRLIG
ncbi:MAG: TRAP transporter large permease [Burkholderiaceae bacterium]